MLFIAFSLARTREDANTPAPAIFEHNKNLDNILSAKIDYDNIEVKGDRKDPSEQKFRIVLHRVKET